MTGSIFRLVTAFFTSLMIAGGPAFAQEGQPQSGEMGFQGSVTPIMDSIRAFHDGLLLWIIGVISAFVLILLIWVMVRYNRRANPEPSKTTHNTLVEVVWTVVPVMILIVIAIPSFGVLADQMTIPDGERKYLGSNIFSYGEVDVPAPALTIKVTGIQWYWNYEYVDEDAETPNPSFDSTILLEDSPPDYNGNPTDRPSLKPNQPRLLAVDNELVVPVDTTVRVQVTASDVLHAFAVPSFGIKMDAVPGRLNETWFHARREGIYYGQCSELCGKDHAFMPIAVRVVSQDEFDDWFTALQAGDVYSANEQLAAIN